MAISGLKRKRKRSNIFVSYFIMFASIFLITFAVLGTALLIFVNKYSVDEKTKLLKENTQSIANKKRLYANRFLLFQTALNPMFLCAITRAK